MRILFAPTTGNYFVFFVSFLYLILSADGSLLNGKFLLVSPKILSELHTFYMCHSKFGMIGMFSFVIAQIFVCIRSQHSKSGCFL